MKSKRVVSMLMVALSSFVSSLASGENVNNELRGGKNETNKLSVSFKNSQEVRSNYGNKLLGKKRARSWSGELEKHVQRNGKGLVNAKGDGVSGKGLNSNGVSKSFAKNGAPVSSNQVTPVNRTLIPHVPNPVTYTVGTLVGTVVVAGTSETIADKAFHRSMIDKLRFGTTVKGVIDYLKAPGNLKLVSKKVSNDNICLLQVKLTDNKYMYVSPRVNGHVTGYKCFFKQNLENLLDVELKQNVSGELEGAVNCNGKISDLWDNDGGKLVIGECVSGLLDLCRNCYNSADLKGSIFDGVNFSVKDREHIWSVIRPYVENIFASTNTQDLKIFKFKWELML